MIPKILLSMLAGLLLGIFCTVGITKTTPIKHESGQVAPFVDLTQYQVWSLPDSLSLCGPDGYCSEMPHGTLILTPLPETVPPPIMY